MGYPSLLCSRIRGRKGYRLRPRACTQTRDSLLKSRLQSEPWIRRSSSERSIQKHGSCDGSSQGIRSRVNSTTSSNLDSRLPQLSGMTETVPTVAESRLNSYSLHVGDY